MDFCEDCHLESAYEDSVNGGYDEWEFFDGYYSDPDEDEDGDTASYVASKHGF